VRTRQAALLVILILIGLIASGCDVVADFGKPKGGPYPEACAQWYFSARRCEAIVDRARRSAQVAEADVGAIQLLPFEFNPGLGGGQVALIRFELKDGETVDEAVTCVGVGGGPACNDAATISIAAGIDHDVPCAGEPPLGCATLPPSPAPAAIAVATPFHLASIDIPLDHEGPYAVKLGTATLPDGYLQERSLGLVDNQPDTFWIGGDSLLDVRPDIAGRPFVGSVYREPFDGPEPVTIFLVFEVTDLDSPSVLQVRDIVVR
jgi:hypothetical protein